MIISNFLGYIEVGVSWPWPECYNYFCNYSVFIGTAANICSTTGQWPSL